MVTEDQTLPAKTVQQLKEVFQFQESIDGLESDYFPISMILHCLSNILMDSVALTALPMHPLCFAL